MSKNLTRKSVAFGALIALGTSLIAGAPAQAANVTIAPSAGTGNTTILGESFVVQSTLDALVPEGSYGKVKFKVTNDSGAALTYVITNGSGTTESVDGSASDASTGTSDVVGSNVSSPASTATLGISTTATTATSVSVVAFIDSDNGDDLDSGEYQTAAYEVKFVKAADAGLTVAWAPQIGDMKLTATVKSTVVNVAQIATGHVKVKWGKYDGGVKQSLKSADSGTDNYATANSTNSATSAALNADKDARVVTLADAVATHADWDPLTAGSYLARAVHYDGSSVYTNAGDELAVSAAATEADAAESEYEIVASENVTSAGIVRSAYKGDVVYKVTVADEDGKVLSGKNVRLTTDTTKTGTFTVNGVTSAVTTTYDAVTNSSGVATFTIKSSTAATNDTFKVLTIVADGVEIEDDAINLVWTAAAFTVYEKGASFASGNYNRSSSASTATVTYVVLDQWKKALAGAAYRIHATLSGSSVAVITDTLEDGAGTITFTDGGLDTSGKATTVAAKYQELVSGTWQDAASAIADPTDPSDRVINWIAAQTDKVTLEAVTSTGAQGTGSTGLTDSDLSATIAAKKTAAVDTALANVPEVFAPVGTNADRVLISGEVTNASTAAPKKGALVTVSGDSSILFQVGTTWAFGSLTFNATSAGVFEVAAYSNKAQADSVVTVTSNGVSKTAKVTFTGTAAVADVVAVTVDAPAYVAAGRSVAFKFTAVDKYGNAVLLTGGTDDLVSITQTGAGYLTSTPTVFTKGVASLVLITQPNDTGAAVIKAVASLNAETDITTTATVTIGSAPVAGATAAIAGSTKRFFVSVSGNSTAKNVVVKVAGKTFKTLKGSTAKKTYLVAAPKGSHKVTVFVGGKLIATKTVSVK